VPKSFGSYNNRLLAEKTNFSPKKDRTGGLNFPTFAEQFLGMEQKASLLGVVQSLYKWRKHIVIICGIAGLGTALISLFLPNYYQASTLFYAAHPDLAKPEILFNRGNQLRSFYYGGEEDVDRLLTIGESAELLDYLVDSFDLYERYDINPELPKAPIRVREEFLSLYEVQRNKRDAIDLSVEDRDPEIAAQMANAARMKINELAQLLIKKNQEYTLKAYRSNLQNKASNLNQLGDSLALERAQYEIYNIQAQSEILTGQYSSARAQLARETSKLNTLRDNRSIPRDTIAYLSATVNGLETQVDSLSAQMERFRTGMARIQRLEKEYVDANQTLSEDRERTKQLQATYDADISAIILVEEAEVPVVKSRPRRSIIVIAAGAIAFIFSVLGVLLLEAYRSIKWREVFKDA